MNSPPKILKLWLKAVKKHEDGKAKADLSKKGQELKERIKKGLVNLKLAAVADLTKEKPRQKFEKMRDGVGRVMQKYCRHLKSAKDEDKKVLPAFSRMVKQLTVLVINLAPAGLDLDDSDVPMGQLDQVDIGKLEEALNQLEPTEEDEIEQGQAIADLFATPEETGEKEEETEEKQEEAEEKQEETDQSEEKPDDKTAMADFTERRTTLEKDVLAALKANQGDTSRIRAVFGAALDLADRREFPRAMAALENLDRLLKGGPSLAEEAKQTAAAKDDSDKQLEKDFTARLKELMEEFGKFKSLPATETQDVKLGLSEAGVCARKKDYEQGQKVLDRVELYLDSLLDQAAMDGGDPKLLELRFKKKLAQFMPAYNELEPTAGEKGKDAKLKLSECGMFGRKRDYEGANKAVDELQLLIGKLRRDLAPKEEEEGEGDDADMARLDKIQHEWAAASDSFGAAMGAMRDSFYELDKALDDAEAEDARSAAAACFEALEAMVDEVHAAMDAVADKWPPEDEGPATEAQQRLLAMQTFLTTDSRFAACEKNTVGVKLTVLPGLLKMVEDLVRIFGAVRMAVAQHA